MVAKLKGSPRAMSLAAYLASPENLTRYLITNREANRFARQGTLEVLVGKVEFTTDGTGNVVETLRTALLDGRQQSQAGGLVLQKCDATNFGGKVPSGQAWLIRGIGYAIHSNGPQSLTAHDLELLAFNMSSQINLRGTPVDIGPLSAWPSPYGARGTGNGNVQDGVPTLTPWITLKQLEDFTIRIERERPVQIGLLEAVIHITSVLPIVRIYDPDVLARS